VTIDLGKMHRRIIRFDIMGVVRRMNNEHSPIFFPLHMLR
jgi:hypothetical protein